MPQFGKWFWNGAGSEIPVLFCIKLRNQVSDKQINTDTRPGHDEQIDGQHPASGKTRIGNQPVEKEVIGDMLRSMGEADENKIQNKEENTHGHAEEAQKGNKLPVAPEAF